jgi:hypothetical protein
MSESASKRTDQAGTPESLAVPAAIRLVHAFRDAVEASKRRQSRADEVFVVKDLLVAAGASFTAVSGYADLWHAGTYGKTPSAEAGDEQTVVDGYEAWLDGADPLLERLVRLPVKAGSPLAETVERFMANHRAARDVLNDARDRRILEGGTLRTDQLIELAGRLKPRQASYDEEETTP